jgi:hypothetical protein
MDPEGAAQGVRRFSKGHGCPLEKSRRHPLGGLALIGEAPFLLVTFLWALSKKSNSPKAKAFDPKTN